jgi:hypothetical protein
LFHISQPLELCFFGVFKRLEKREQQTKETEEETIKIYGVIMVFYKATIIPMVRWRLLPAGFRLNPRDLLAPLVVTPV